MKVGRFEGLSSCMCPHPSHQVIIGRVEASTKEKLKVSDQRRSRTTVPVVEARWQGWNFRRNKGKGEVEL